MEYINITPLALTEVSNNPDNLSCNFTTNKLKDKIIYKYLDIEMINDCYCTYDGIRNIYNSIMGINLPTYSSNHQHEGHWHIIKYNCLVTFTGLSFKVWTDNVSITVKDYSVDVLQEDGNWVNVYIGIFTGPSCWDTEGNFYAHANDDYTKVSVSFDEIQGTAIRINILSTYDRRGYKWEHISHLNIFGMINNPFTIYNNNFLYSY